MATSRPPIIVGIDGTTAGDQALRWALDDAVVRNDPVQVVCCHRRPMTIGGEVLHPVEVEQMGRAAHDFADEVVEKALELARGIAPEVEVTGDVVDGHPAAVLTDRSADAARLVVGSRHLKAFGSAILGSVGAGVSARAQCPVIVIRGPAGLAAEHPAVVVGVDGIDGTEQALQFGFEHASRHGVPLHALMCWRPDPLATMQWAVEAPAPSHAQAWLTETVEKWNQRYPEVAASGAVVRDHPVAGLVARSAAQHLLVVRSRTRHAIAGTLLGSVSQGVLHHATCPVAVIPTAVE